MRPMSSTRAIQVLLAIAGVVLGVLAYRVQMDNLPLTTTARSQASVVAAWSFLLAGLVAWQRRPENRLGPLMVAVCFALLARQFRYSHDDLAFTVFFLIGELGYALVAHVALAYPSGRVTDRLERAFVRLVYVVAVVFPLAILLFDDGQKLRYFDPVPRTSVIVIHGSDDVVDLLQDVYAVTAYGILATLFVALIVRKLVRATPRARRVLWPLLLAAVVAALRAVLDSILSFSSGPPGFTVGLFWWQVVALTALPIALLWGLLRASPACTSATWWCTWRRRHPATCGTSSRSPSRIRRWRWACGCPSGEPTSTPSAGPSRFPTTAPNGP
jgi:hypothetical protein